MVTVGILCISAYLVAVLWLCIRHRKRMAKEQGELVYGAEGSLHHGGDKLLDNEAPLFAIEVD